MSAIFGRRNRASRFVYAAVSQREYINKVANDRNIGTYISVSTSRKVLHGRLLCSFQESTKVAYVYQKPGVPLLIGQTITM